VAVSSLNLFQTQCNQQTFYTLIFATHTQGVPYGKEISWKKKAEIIPIEKCCGVFHAPDPGNAGGGRKVNHREFISTLLGHFIF